MSNWKLLSITIEGFKSFQEEQTIEFGFDGGLFFLGGDNQKEPRLGGNGAGKSSLWDALVWCQTGLSVKGNRASELVSWGVKRPQVIVRYTDDFFLQENILEICRVGNPDLLLLNGEKVTQEQVDAAVGLPRARFLQSVIFGQMVPLFLDLPVPKRGELLDEVLDLGYWLDLSDKAGEKARMFRDETVRLTGQIGRLEGEWNGLEHIDTVRADHDEWYNEQQNRIKILLDEVEVLGDEVVRIEESLSSAEIGLASANKKLSVLSKRWDAETQSQNDLRFDQRTINERLDRTIEQQSFYQSHTTCPTCLQTMGKKMIEQRLAELVLQRETDNTSLLRVSLEIKQRTNVLQTINDERIQILQTINDYRTKIATHREQLRTKDERIQTNFTLVKQIEDTEVNPFEAKLKALRIRTTEIETKIKELKDVFRSAEENAIRAEWWKSGFKRLRLRIIDRVLKAFEIETANAASVLGLPDWEIKFVTEVETKSGSKKPGIQVLVKSPIATAPWEVWSGGEGQRIRLAVSIGISNMIQRSAGVDFGFEVWDEPSNWLSPEGIEDLLECLRYRAERTGKAVWVLDHRALTFSGFDQTWQVVKDETGSHIRRVS